MSTIDYGTVRGRYLATTRDSTNPDTPDLTPMSGTVTLTAQVDALLTEDATLLPAPIVCRLDADGDLTYTDDDGVTTKSVRVTATDTLTNPTDFTYRVSHNLTHEKRHVPYASFNIQVPSGSVVDLETVAPVPTSTGEAIVRGESAYESALLEGFNGTREEWITSLEGAEGPIGPQGPEGPQGLPGTAVEKGWSAYEVAVNVDGFVGTESEWLASLEGPEGPQGPAGPQGLKGDKGDSAYEEAVALGFVGTKEEWYASLEGPIGPTGLAGDQGPRGTMWYTDFDYSTPELVPNPLVGDLWWDRDLYGQVKRWDGTSWTVYTYLEGPQGPQGPQGLQGQTGAQGVEGPQGPQGPEGDTGAQGPAGPIGMEWRGIWSATVDYVNDDAVYHNGSSWFAFGDPPLGDEPMDGSTYWNPMALRGQQGPKGDQGLQGPKGDQGIQGVEGPQGPQGETGLQGLPGDTGSQGPQGPQGIDGSRWYTQADYIDYIDVPNPRIGDQFLYSGSGDVMTYTDAGWVWGGNIKGETGEVGPQGPAGVGVEGGRIFIGTAPTTPVAGDILITEA